jgi:hypothetical protein
MTKKLLSLVFACSIAMATMTMTACTTDQILSSIDAALQVAQGLSGAVGAVNPADGSELTLLSGIGITGMNAIQSAYDAYKKNKTASTLQNVLAAAQAIQTNLPQELAALHISDPIAVQKATGWVNLLTDCAGALITELSAVNPPVASKAALYTFTPETIQKRWLMDVCRGDTTCGSKVVAHHYGNHSKAVRVLTLGLAK